MGERIDTAGYVCAAPAFTITKQMCAVGNICFTVEATLGKLAKWLRILGFDALYEGDTEYPGPGDPSRIRLTRRQNMSRTMGNGRGGSVIFIASDHYQEQVKQVLRELNIKQDALKLFSRCIRCNALIQPIERESVLGKVPDYIFETHRSFWTCRACQRIFWQGSHHRQSLNRIKQLFDD